MSMYRYIKGISDSNKIEKAKQIRDNCKFLNLEYPAEIDKIIENSIDIPCREYTDASMVADIIEINVKDIPKEVEKIQFIISY